MLLKSILRVLAAQAFLFIANPTAHAAPVNMTRADLNALVSVVRVITLGGPSQDYIGALILTKTGALNGNAVGTGRGVAIISGTVRNFTGTWAIRGSQFCRKWSAFDGGREVCETWQYLTQSSVSVRVGGAEIGVNSW